MLRTSVGQLRISGNRTLHAELAPAKPTRQTALAAHCSRGNHCDRGSWLLDRIFSDAQYNSTAIRTRGVLGPCICYAPAGLNLSCETSRVPTFPEMYRRYSRAHPGTFETEEERSNQALPLDNNEKLGMGRHDSIPRLWRCCRGCLRCRGGFSTAWKDWEAKPGTDRRELYLTRTCAILPL